MSCRVTWHSSLYPDVGHSRAGSCDVFPVSWLACYNVGHVVQGHIDFFPVSWCRTCRAGSRDLFPVSWLACYKCRTCREGSHDLCPVFWCRTCRAGSRDFFPVSWLACLQITMRLMSTRRLGWYTWYSDQSSSCWEPWVTDSASGSCAVALCAACPRASTSQCSPLQTQVSSFPVH